MQFLPVTVIIIGGYNISKSRNLEKKEKIRGCWSNDCWKEKKKRRKKEGIFMIVSKKHAFLWYTSKRSNDGLIRTTRSLEANKIRATCNVYVPWCVSGSSDKTRKPLSGSVASVEATKTTTVTPKGKFSSRVSFPRRTRETTNYQVQPPVFPVHVVDLWTTSLSFF